MRCRLRRTRLGEDLTGPKCSLSVHSRWEAFRQQVTVPLRNTAKSVYLVGVEILKTEHTVSLLRGPSRLVEL
jgi:hypothetical protein